MKIKGFINEQFNFLKYYSRTKGFIINLALIFIVTIFYSAVFSVNVVPNTNFIEIFITILGARPMLLLNFLLFSINVYYIFNITSNYLMRIRYDSQQESKKKSFIFVVSQSFLIFLFEFIIIVIVINFFSKASYEIIFDNNRSIYNVVYFLWYLFRYIAFYLIYSLIICTIYDKISKKASLVFAFVYSVYIFFSEIYFPENYLINNIQDIGFRFSIFLKTYQYSSFFFEIMITLFYFITLYSFIKKIYKIDFELKYLSLKIIVLLKEIKSFILKNKSIIITYLIIIFIISIMENHLIKNMDENYIKNIIGYMSFKTNSIYRIFVKFLNVSLILYITSKSFYEKTRLGNANIFLRMKEENFLYSYFAYNLLIVGLIKFCVNLAGVIPFVLFGNFSLNSLSICLIDIVQYLVISILYVYIIISIYNENKNKMVCFLLLGIIFAILNYYLIDSFYIVFVVFFEILASLYIFKNNKNIIFELMEE